MRRRRGKRIARGVLWWSVAFLLFFFLISLSVTCVNTDVDASFKAAMRERICAPNDATQALVYTYGPLGFLALNPSDPNLIPWHGIFEVVVKCAAALLFLYGIARRIGRERALLFALIAIVGINLFPSELSLLFLIQAIALYYLQIRRPPAGGWAPIAVAYAAAGVLVILSFVKFTFCLQAFLLAGLVLLRAAMEREARFLAGPALAVPIGYGLAGWFLVGPPWELARNWMSCFHLAAAYCDNMSLNGPLDELQVGISAFLLFIVLASPTLVRPFPPRARTVLHVLFLLATLFMQWKHGFARHDAHSGLFFGFVILVPLFCPFPGSRRLGPMRRSVLAAILLLAIPETRPMCVGRPPRPDDLVRRVILHGRVVTAYGLRSREVMTVLDEHENEVRKANRLPAIGREIGPGRVDFIGVRQGFLFLNAMTWWPRPVFQGHLAFHPALIRENLRWARGPDGPEFLMYDGVSVDGRLPNVDDGPVVLEMLQCWKPVRLERGVLLFRRPRVSPEDVSTTPSIPLFLSPGEWTHLPLVPGTPASIAMDLHPSFRGRLRSGVFCLPPLWLEVETVSGETIRHRLPPGTASSPFLISPYLPDAERMADWLEGGQAKDVSRIRILTGSANENDNGLFQWPVRASLQPASIPRDASIAREDDPDTRF